MKSWLFCSNVYERERCRKKIMDLPTMFCYDVKNFDENIYLIFFLIASPSGYPSGSNPELPGGSSPSYPGQQPGSDGYYPQYTSGPQPSYNGTRILL